jgi:hypothetical protein
MMAVIGTLSGCASTTPKDLDAQGARGLIQPSDLINVALADVDRTRVDHYWFKDYESKESFITGSQWARVFVGRVSKEPLFTIHQARLYVQSTGGFATTIRYSVDAVLAYGARDWPISVEGTVMGWLPSDRNVAEAVHDGIAKAAAACRAIMSQGTEGPPR